MGVPLDFIYAWSRIRTPKKPLLFAVDVSYCLIDALFFFLMLLRYSDGSMRLSFFVLAATGGFIYFHTLGKLLRRFFTALERAHLRAGRWLKKRVFVPVGRVFKKT